MPSMPLKKPSRLTTLESNLLSMHLLHRLTLTPQPLLAHLLTDSLPTLMLKVLDSPLLWTKPPRTGPTTLSTSVDTRDTRAQSSRTSTHPVTTPTSWATHLEMVSTPILEPRDQTSETLVKPTSQKADTELVDRVVSTTSLWRPHRTRLRQVRWPRPRIL